MQNGTGSSRNHSIALHFYNPSSLTLILDYCGGLGGSCLYCAIIVTFVARLPCQSPDARDDVGYPFEDADLDDGDGLNPAMKEELDR
jgi:hypothetical protein